MKARSGIDVSSTIRQTANQKIDAKAKYIFDGQAVYVELTVNKVEKFPLAIYLALPWGTIYGMWKKHKKEGGKAQ